MLTKVCGLTNISEVDYLKENKVDFAGIVLFFEKSKRNLSIDKAKVIVDKIHEETSDMKVVAVVVSPSLSQVKEIVDTGFDYIQIHGSVSDEIFNECTIPVLKAFNVDDLDYYEHFCSILNIKGFVFDAGQPGSGKIFDWKILNSLIRYEDKLYILAGGLNSTNIISAIESVNPDGVDVSSGVEYDDKPGKDPEKIKEFISLARHKE